MSTFFESVGGRKFGLIVLAIVATVVVGIVKDLDATKILDSIMYLTGIGAGSIALEDGLKAIGTGKTEDKTPTT